MILYLRRNSWNYCTVVIYNCGCPSLDLSAWGAYYTFEHFNNPQKFSNKKKTAHQKIPFCTYDWLYTYTVYTLLLRVGLEIILINSFVIIMFTQ